ncbi:MAG: ribosome maturation factor RimM, partial [Lysobacterales bacterium]
MSTRKKKYVALGHISAVHGVKGWVKVYSFTRPMEAILGYQPWLLGEEKRPVEIVDGRKQGKGLVALLPGCDDRDQAAGLVGQQVFVVREQLPPTEEGEY